MFVSTYKDGGITLLQDPAHGLGLHLGDGKIGADIADHGRGDRRVALVDAQFVPELGAARGAEVHHDERALRPDAEHGGAARKFSTDEFQPADPTVEVGGVLALEDALQALAHNDARAAKVAELRIFGGMPMEQVARMLDLSVATAERDWRLARAWLEKEYDVSLRGVTGDREAVS